MNTVSTRLHMYWDKYGHGWEADWRASDQCIGPRRRLLGWHEGRRLWELLARGPVYHSTTRCDDDHVPSEKSQTSTSYDQAPVDPRLTAF